MQNRKNYVPYISDELKILMKARDDKKVAASESGSIEDFDLYLKMRNEVTSKLRTAKAEYYKTKLSNNNTVRDIWEATSSVLGKIKSEFPPQLIIDKQLISSPRQIAENLNKFFLNKIEKIKNNIPTISTQDALKELKSFLKGKLSPTHCFSLKEISLEETDKIILSSTKSGASTSDQSLD